MDCGAVSHSSTAGSTSKSAPATTATEINAESTAQRQQQQRPMTTATLVRLSRLFLRFPPSSLFFRRRSRGSSKSSPGGYSPKETTSNSSDSPKIESSINTPLNGNSSNAGLVHHYKPLLRPEEIKLVSNTLNKALKEVDFGNEIVIRLLNDKRSLFKSLLARCAPQAHEIEVFDVQSLARFCPRGVQVGDGVTRFFERVAILLEREDISSPELEEKLSEMCRANGQMHYRMKVWFQAENWLCVKHSVVDTILMANSNLKRGKQLRSAGDLYGISSAFHRRCLNRFDTMENHNNSNGRNYSSNNEKQQQAPEVVWMKLMQAVIAWMKQGFLDAAMNGKEEQDEQL